MKDLCDLLDHLSSRRKSGDQARLVAHFFASDRGPESALTVALLAGPPPKSCVSVPALKQSLFTRIDEALFDVSKPEATDVSETLALLWPGGPGRLCLKSFEDALVVTDKTERLQALATLLDTSDSTARDFMIRVATGRFKSPVSPAALRTALARAAGKTLADVEEAFAYSRPPWISFTNWLFFGANKPAPDMASHFLRIPQIETTTSPDLQNFTSAAALPSGDWSVLVLSNARAILYSLQGDQISASPCATNIEASFLALVPQTKPATQPILVDVIALDAKDLRSASQALRLKHMEAMAPALTRAGFTIAHRVMDPGPGRFERLFRSLDCRQILLFDPAASLQPASRPWVLLEPPPTAFNFVVLYTEGPLARSGVFDGIVTLGATTASRPGSNAWELVSVGKASVNTLGPEDRKRLEAWIDEHTLERFGPVRKLAATPQKHLCVEALVRRVDEAPRRKAGLVIQDARLTELQDGTGPITLITLDQLSALALL